MIQLSTAYALLISPMQIVLTNVSLVKIIKPSIQKQKNVSVRETFTMMEPANASAAHLQQLGTSKTKNVSDVLMASLLIKTLLSASVPKINLILMLITSANHATESGTLPTLTVKLARPTKHGMQLPRNVNARAKTTMMGLVNA